MESSILCFLNQNESLKLDRCCKALRAIVSRPDFWFTRTLHVSRFLNVIHERDRLRKVQSVLLQPRFAKCRAVDLSRIELPERTWKILFASMLPGVKEFDLSSIDNKNIMASLFSISPKVLKISFNSHHMSRHLAGMYQYQDLLSLTITTFDGETTHPTDLDCYFLKLPSLQYLEIQNCFSMNTLGVQFLFTNLQELRHLALLNWRTPRILREATLLRLAPCCPPNLESLVLDVQSECLQEFWRRVREYRLRQPQRRR